MNKPACIRTQKMSTSRHAGHRHHLTSWRTRSPPYIIMCYNNEIREIRDERSQIGGLDTPPPLTGINTALPFSVLAGEVGQIVVFFILIIGRIITVNQLINQLYHSTAKLRKQSYNKYTYTQNLRRIFCAKWKNSRVTRPATALRTHKLMLSSHISHHNLHPPNLHLPTPHSFHSPTPVSISPLPSFSLSPYVN